MTTQKTNWISFIGIPNSGKSTLLNQLIGSKISIVSPKVQTTRTMLKGIKMVDDVQLVFTDTPGIFSKVKSKLEKYMVKTAWAALQDGNITCVIIDCIKALSSENLELLNNLAKQKISPILILNKIDLIKKHELLPIIAQLKDMIEFEQLFMISALKNDGIDTLEKYFISTAIQGPWQFDPEHITDAPLRFLAAEAIREKVFLYTDQELPYNIAVIVEKWEETEKLTRIMATIKVVRLSHKKIIIGSGGSLLKKIGTKARIDIENLLGKKVFLELFVKITSWDHDLQEMIDFH